jgi:excinuclease ABC subunit C
MGQCSAPCHGRISAADYALLVKGAVLLLEGRNRELLASYRTKMTEASQAERYEEAAKYRDIIHAIEVTVERQKMVASRGDSDVIGFHRNGSQLEVCVLFIRSGALIDHACYSLSWEFDETEWLESFLNEYYGRDVLVPAEVVVPLPLESKAELEELLSERKGSKVRIFCASRGTKRELMTLASRNAEAAAEQVARRRERAEDTLEELRDKLSLSRLPRRIECYDISNIQGDLAVGSCVVFADGKPAKSDYRRYRIKTVAGADDFAMLREVLTRRFIRGLDAGTLPDLIVIDGGIGQLNAVTAVMKDMGITGVEAVSLAKSRVKGSSRDTDVIRTDERVFLPGRKNPVVLRQNSSPLLLLARARDEAHRFAVSYHTNLRGKNSFNSPLDDIPGIGMKRKKILLQQFGSLSRLRDATLAELRQTKGLSASVAEALYQSLHKNEKGDNP